MNETATTRPPARVAPTVLVQDTIRAWAEREPYRLAVTADADSLTYAELDRRANQLAWTLLRAGVVVETPVAVLAPRSVEMLVSFLAVLKAGASAVLLDPAHPDARIRRSCEEVGVALVLSVARLGRELPIGVPVIRVDMDWHVAQQQAETDPGVRVHLDNVAYLIHTSGSTGTPKRVMITHRSIAHSVTTHRDGHRIAPDDRAAWLAAPGASTSVGELWPYLTSGASVHAAPADIGADAASLRDWLVAQRIEKAFVGMPVAEQLIGLTWPADAALRLLTIGSDRVRRWAAVDLPFEVAVSCGSSEANGVTSGLSPWHDRTTNKTATPDLRAAVPPIGRAWPDVRLHILDRRLRQVAPGEIGELHVAGPELARGYLGAPGETARRFVPDPFGPPGERLYRTGDQASRGADDLVYHHGRTDNEVRIHGNRVDPAEVEIALLAVPGISNAVVVPAVHPSGEMVLAAYVVGRTDGLKDIVAGQLPPHLVPAAFISLDSLPLNANHKVDRHALPTPDWPRLRAEYEPPRTELERVVAGIWSDVLGIANVGVRDHFFDLGGNSLSGARVMSRISRQLGRRVPMRDLLRHATPESLAAYLGDLAPRASAAGEGTH
jgi:amino acid adenylation domain-containing protein